MFQFGLHEYEKRCEEVDLFWSCVEEAKQENKEMGMKAVDQFMQEKRVASFYWVLLLVHLSHFLCVIAVFFNMNANDSVQICSPGNFRFMADHI
jgi:hypothetical protein